MNYSGFIPTTQWMGKYSRIIYFYIVQDFVHVISL